MPRNRNRRKSTLTQQLTDRDVRREVRAAGRMAVGPEQRILQAERRTSNVQSRRIRDWFPQYGQAVGQAAQRTRAGYQAADQGIAQASTQAQSYAEAMRQKLAAESQSDANLRGVQYDPSGSATNAQAQLARINSSNTLRGVTASQGAAQGAYLQDKRRIGQREKVEQLLREEQRRRSYTEDLRDLAKRKSDAMLQEKSRLRDSERDYYLGLLAARGQKASRKLSRKEALRDRRFSHQQEARGRQFDRKENAKDRRAAEQAATDDGRRGPERLPSPRSALADLRDYGRGLNRRDQANFDRRAAIDYLITQGYTPKVARQAVTRLLDGPRAKRTPTERGVRVDPNADYGP